MYNNPRTRRLSYRLPVHLLSFLIAVSLICRCQWVHFYFCATQQFCLCQLVQLSAAALSFFVFKHNAQHRHYQCKWHQHGKPNNDCSFPSLLFLYLTISLISCTFKVLSPIDSRSFSTTLYLFLKVFNFLKKLSAQLCHFVAVNCHYFIAVIWKNWPIECFFHCTNWQMKLLHSGIFALPCTWLGHLA